MEYEYDIRGNIRGHIHNVQICPRKTSSWSCRFCFPFCARSCLARAALELLVQCIAFRIVIVWRHGKAVEYRHAGFATDPVKMRILQLDGNKHRRTVPERSAPKCLRRWVYMLQFIYIILFQALYFLQTFFFAVGGVNRQHEKTCNGRTNIWEKTRHIENWDRLKVIDGIFQDIPSAYVKIAIENGH